MKKMTEKEFIKEIKEKLNLVDYYNHLLSLE
jgi:hypothetical protein